jgi:tetratricopeptide (TPR) repeat protein
MSLTPRWALIGLVLVLAGPLLAQNLPGWEKPEVHVPVTKPTRQELDRREAQRLFAQGAINERKNRLVEAIRAYEAAGRLDPDSAAIPRALAPLYLAVDRIEDALDACRKVLARVPGDYRTGYLLARQLRGLDRLKEAIAVLKKITKAPGLKERPDEAAQIWYDLALLQEKTDDLAGAEKSLRRVAGFFENPAAMIAAGHCSREEVTTQAAETWERLGQVCLKAKAIDRAVRAFEQAQKKDPLRAPRLAYNLAQVYRDRGKHREALAQLEIYLQTQPQGVEGYEMKLDLQRKLRRHADILPDLETASGRDPHNLALRLLLARETRKAGKALAAERIYSDLLKRHLNSDVYRGLFDLYKDEGRPGAERILTRLDAALELATGDEKRPGNPGDAANARAMLGVLRDDADLVKMILEAAIGRLKARPLSRLSYPTRAVMATLAARTKQLDHAEQLYRACLDRPGGLGVMEAEVYAGLLEVLQLRHDHKGIVEIGKLGLAKAQQTNRVMFHRALVYAYLGLEKYKEALAAADAAVTDSGKGQQLGSRKVRAYALSEAGKHAEAVAECQAMLKEYNQGGELREVRLTLSRVYLTMGKDDLSDEQLEMILKADPNDSTACNDLGYHWADRGKNLEEAERLIRKAIDLDRKQRTSSAFPSPDSDKDNAAFVDSLGWVLFKRGKLAEARDELVRTMTLPGGDDDPVVFDHLGDVYYRLKENGKALAAWKKALALFETGTRRKTDGRYKEIQDKVRLLKP